MGGPSDWGLGIGLTASHLKNKIVTNCHIGLRTWSYSLDNRPKLRKRDMRFGTWNVRGLYRAGNLMTVVKKI
jgi:hypothetical protein